MAASQTIRTLKLALLADVSQFGPELKKGADSFDRFQAGISKAAVPAAAALAAIGGAAFSAVQAAADLEQTFGAVEQIFGASAAGQLDRFARTAADSLGQSRAEALGAAQTFGVLGRSAGLEGKELADFAITLTELASDLAAFGNTTPQEAIEALGSALRGEFNPIERFGVVLNAAAVQSIALREGLAETAATITTEDQVYARFLGIMEETAIQQGQAARESESLASQVNVAKAQLENFRIEVGEELLPKMVELIPLLQSMVTSFVETDTDQIIRIGETIAILAASIVALNTALKVYATLKSTAALLGLGAGAAGAASVAALGGVVAASAIGANRESAIADIDRRIATGDTRFGVASGGYSGVGDFTVLNRNSIAARGGQTTINISGFVGSEVDLARAINRAEAQARRSGQIAPAGSRR